MLTWTSTIVWYFNLLRELKLLKLTGGTHQKKKVLVHTIFLHSNFGKVIRTWEAYYNNDSILGRYLEYIVFINKTCCRQICMAMSKYIKYGMKLDFSFSKTEWKNWALHSPWQPLDLHSLRMALNSWSLDPSDLASGITGWCHHVPITGLSGWISLDCHPPK